MALPTPCTARRLVNAESDGLPGLIVDQYGAYLVCQFLSAGTEFWKQVIVHELRQLVSVNGIYERSDAEVRSKEGLPETTALLWGEPPPELVEVRAGEAYLLVDILKGHKTGFYLDQRDNRLALAEMGIQGDVLDAFCYSGGFGLHLALNGCRVLGIDSQREAIAQAEANRDRKSVV